MNWMNDDSGNMIPGSEWLDRIGKNQAGRLLDGREWNEFPKGGGIRQDKQDERDRQGGNNADLTGRSDSGVRSEDSL